MPQDQRNIAWLLLTDPAMRDLYTDWSTGAQEHVAMLRRASGKYPDDRALQRLIGRLSTHSPDFSRWWSQQQVHQKTSGTKTLRHPNVGQITLNFQVLHPAGTPNYELFLYLPASSAARDQLDALRVSTA